MSSAPSDWTAPRTDWIVGNVPTSADYNRAELNLAVVRDTPTLPLRVEVRNTFPAHAVGLTFFHSVDRRLYTSNGTGWV